MGKVDVRLYSEGCVSEVKTFDVFGTGQDVRSIVIRCEDGNNRYFVLDEGTPGLKDCEKPVQGWGEVARELGSPGGVVLTPTGREERLLDMMAKLSATVERLSRRVR